MAKSKTSDWDTTNGNNTDIDGINIAEGCPAANVNNALREIMAQVATARTGDDDGIVTGTAGADGQIPKWNADGDLVDSGASLSGADTTIVTGTAGTDGNLSKWNADGDLIDAGVSLSGSDATAITGTAGTDGNLSQWNADGDLVDGPAYGTSGANKLLQLDASGNLPALDGSNLTGTSGMRFLATVDASNDSTIAFTQLNGSLYDAYLIVGTAIIPASDGVNLYMRTSSNGGSSYDSGASNYEYRVNSQHMSSVIPSGIVGPAAQIPLTTTTIGSGAGEYGVSFIMDVLMPHLAVPTFFSWRGVYQDTAGSFIQLQSPSGVRAAAADVDAIGFFFSSGNIESGSITLWGLRNS